MLCAELSHATAVIMGYLLSIILPALLIFSFLLDTQAVTFPGFNLDSNVLLFSFFHTVRFSRPLLNVFALKTFADTQLKSEHFYSTSRNF